MIVDAGLNGADQIAWQLVNAASCLPPRLEDPMRDQPHYWDDRNYVGG